MITVVIVKINAIFAFLMCSYEKTEWENIMQIVKVIIVLYETVI